MLFVFIAPRLLVVAVPVSPSTVATTENTALGNEIGNVTVVVEFAEGLDILPHWIINPPGNFWYPLEERLFEKEDKEDKEENEEVIEGFAGSQILEAKSMKNVLLAILIAFVGYVIAIASTKNLLPITEISPDLKKFKNLIYAGLFFLVVYLCLEVFQ